MSLNLIIGRGHLVGVEAQLQADGSWLFHWAHLRKRKTAVHVERQGSGIADVATLMDCVGRRYPLVLAVTGDRVLFRSLPNPFDAVRDLGKLLPNARSEDLVISSCIHTECTEVGVVRSQAVTSILSELNKVGMRVVGLFVGNSVRGALDGLVEEDPVSQGSMDLPGPMNQTEASLNQSSVKLGTELLDRSSLTACATAWQFWFYPLELTTSSLPQVVHAACEERFRHLYEFGLMAVTGMLALLLAGDIWLRDHLDVRQAHLQDALEHQRQVQSELDSLAETVQMRKDLISAAGIGHAGGRMRLLDQVSASLPENVVLQDVWLSPASKPVMEGEPIKRERNKLLIQGRAKDPAALPAWVGRLGSIEGVLNARLESLELDPNEGTPVFRITVELS